MDTQNNPPVSRQELSAVEHAIVRSRTVKNLPLDADSRYGLYEKSAVVLNIRGLLGEVTNTIIRSNPEEYRDTPEAALFLAGDLIKAFDIHPAMKDEFMAEPFLFYLAGFIRSRNPEEYRDGLEAAMALTQRLAQDFHFQPKKATEQVDSDPTSHAEQIATMRQQLNVLQTALSLDDEGNLQVHTGLRVHGAFVYTDLTVADHRTQLAVAHGL